MKGNGELIEKVKAVEEMKRVLEEKDAVISKLETKIEVLESEKKTVKEEFRDRLFKMEKLVRKWLLQSAGTRNREINDFLGSGQKSAVQLKEPDIKKDVSHALNIPNSQILLISDDVEETEDEEESSAVAAVPDLKSPENFAVFQKRKPGEDVPCFTEKTSFAVTDDVPAHKSPENFAVFQKRKPGEDVKCFTEKSSSAVTAVPALESPGNFAVLQKRKPGEDVRCSTEKRSSAVAAVPALKSPENFEALQKRKSEEAVTFSTEKEAETKRYKYGDPKEGKLWPTAEKMYFAFTTNNIELCMKSVCALYRKHKSLGVWKNQSDGNGTFIPICDISGVKMGNFLTAGDPEGRLKISVAEMKRQNSTVLYDCMNICRHHFKELFRIYNNDLDPLYLP